MPRGEKRQEMNKRKFHLIFGHFVNERLPDPIALIFNLHSFQWTKNGFLHNQTFPYFKSPGFSLYVFSNEFGKQKRQAKDLWGRFQENGLVGMFKKKTGPGNQSPTVSWAAGEQGGLS